MCGRASRGNLLLTVCVATAAMIWRTAVAAITDLRADEPAAPAPAPPAAACRIVNPASTGAPFGYLLDDEQQNLEAGYVQEVTPGVVIKFDRGGDAGNRRIYTGRRGRTPSKSSEGHWELVQGEPQDAAPAGDANRTVTDIGSNPAAPVAACRIVNPASTGAPFGFTLDAEQQSLEAGYVKEVTPGVVIKFDRGGDAGVAEYTLGAGTYTFKSVDGHWELVPGEPQNAAPGGDANRMVTQASAQGRAVAGRCHSASRSAHARRAEDVQRYVRGGRPERG